MPLPSAKIYPDCLLNPPAADRIKADVLEKRNLLRNLKYRYILPLPHLCGIYAELSGLNKEIPFSEPAPAPAEKDSESSSDQPSRSGCLREGLKIILVLEVLFVLAVILMIHSRRRSSQLPCGTIPLFSLHLFTRRLQKS
jgi:hypothetical protein